MICRRRDGEDEEDLKTLTRTIHQVEQGASGYWRTLRIYSTNFHRKSKDCVRTAAAFIARSLANSPSLAALVQQLDGLFGAIHLDRRQTMDCYAAQSTCILAYRKARFRRFAGSQKIIHFIMVNLHERTANTVGHDGGGFLIVVQPLKEVVNDAWYDPPGFSLGIDVTLDLAPGQLGRKRIVKALSNEGVGLARGRGAVRKGCAAYPADDSLGYFAKMGHKVRLRCSPVQDAIKLVALIRRAILGA